MAKFCINCGEKLADKDVFCSKCGTSVESGEAPQTQSSVTSNVTETKSKIGAGLLALFLGSLGIHNFYLGYNSKAIAQLLLTLIGWILCGLGPIVASIWAIVEGIQILTGSIATDANGIPLKD